MSIPIKSSKPHASDAIKRLLHEQPFAVLCTQADGEPYGSLVAVSASDDLRSVPGSLVHGS